MRVMACPQRVPWAVQKRQTQERLRKFVRRREYPSDPCSKLRARLGRAPTGTLTHSGWAQPPLGVPLSIPGRRSAHAGYARGRSGLRAIGLHLQPRLTAVPRSGPAQSGEVRPGVSPSQGSAVQIRTDRQPPTVLPGPRWSRSAPGRGWVRHPALPVRERDGHHHTPTLTLHLTAPGTLLGTESGSIARRGPGHREARKPSSGGSRTGLLAPVACSSVLWDFSSKT